MIEVLTQIPVFGVIITLLTFWMGVVLQEKTKITFLQPILTSTVLIILILKIANMEYEVYKAQNEFLNFLLPSTAVILAVPLYKNINILKKNAVPVIAGVFLGTLTTIGTCILFGKVLGAKPEIILSMIPKGITNPIAIEVSDIIGGIPSLTVALVVFTGIIGGSFGPEIIRLLGIKNKIAKGIALGTMCHAVGTARAFKEGEVEGAMSSLAMGIAGIFTAIIAPIIVSVLNII